MTARLVTAESLAAALDVTPMPVLYVPVEYAAAILAAIPEDDPYSDRRADLDPTGHIYPDPPDPHLADLEAIHEEDVAELRRVVALLREAEAREARLRAAAQEVVVQRGRYYRDGAEDSALSVVPRVSLRRLDVALATSAEATDAEAR
jgi:hypothetical protein